MGKDNRRPYEQGFERVISDPNELAEGHWWDKLRNARTPGDLPPPGPPTHSKQWVRWGGKARTDAEVLAPALEQPVQFEQILDARIELPTGWLLGLTFDIGGPSPFDTVQVSVNVLWGLGAALFSQTIAVPLLGAPPLSSSYFAVVGPVPAETVVVNASALLSGNVAGVYPHTTSMIFGAFAAPQVWP